MAVLIIIMLSTLALATDAGQLNNTMFLMRVFMGLFFVIFALFKFIDLRGFAKAFAKYDLPTQKCPAYGFIYPFIELGLGLCYLANIAPVPVQILTVIVMLIAGAGVAKAMQAKTPLLCACLGTFLKVKLSTISIIENFGMAAMAAVMLLIY